MERIKRLISTCKGSISIEIDGHKDCYDTVSHYVLGKHSQSDDQEFAQSDVFAKMVELGTCINVRFYPHTPVSFFSIWHYDLDMALDIAMECLDSDS